VNTDSKPFVIRVATCAVLSVKLTDADAELSGTLTFTTNYVSRGYSKSNGDPIAQGKLDYEHDSGFFIGAWASPVDFGDHAFGDRANVEIAPYLGWNFKVSEDWRFDSHLSRYFYDGKLFGQYSDYNELNVLVNFRDLASIRVAGSENFYNRGKYAMDYELTARYPFTDTLEASASLGFSDTLKALHYNYLYWNAGISWFFKYGSMDIRYVQASHLDETMHHGHQARFEPKSVTAEVIFSLSLGF
jgi:uncharacterized protein (TIGR02001 family)